MKIKNFFSALLAVCMLLSLITMIPASAYDAANPLKKDGVTVYAGGVGLEIIVREYTTATAARPVTHTRQVLDPESDPEYPEYITVSDLSTINTPSATGGSFVSVTMYAKANDVAINAHGFAIVMGYDPAVLNPIFKDAATPITLDTQTTEHTFADPLLYKKVTGIIPNLSSANSTIDLANHTISYVITADNGAVIPIDANGYIPICMAQFKKVTSTTVLYSDSLYFSKTSTASASWAYDGLEVIQQKYLSNDDPDKILVPSAFQIKLQTATEIIDFPERPKPKVIGLGTVSDKNVSYGTSWATAIAGLPQSVTATIEHDEILGDSVNVPITWSTTAPSGYGTGVTGSYTATGTLNYPTTVSVNGNPTTINANIIVANPKVLTVPTVSDKTVSYATSWATAIEALPQSLPVTIEGGSINVPVVWSGTAPAGYGIGTAPNTYVATGTLTYPDTVDQNGKSAAVVANVIVAKPKVLSVTAVADKGVSFGTAWATAIEALPQNTNVNTESGTISVPIAWSATAPTGYGTGSTTGAYTATGTITYPSTHNTNGISATITAKIIVGNPKVLSIPSVPDKGVKYGTAWTTAIAGLPQSIEVTVEGGTVSVPVVWSETAPAGYGTGTVPNTYVATGTLTYPNTVDVNGMTTSISANVIVAQRKVVTKAVISAGSLTPTAFVGTTFDSAKALLPQKVTLTFDNDDSTSVERAIVWTCENYNANVATGYTFNGAVTLEVNEADTNSLIPNLATVTLAKKILKTVSSVSKKTVDYGTKFSSIGLPSTLIIATEDQPTTNITVSVNWDSSDYKSTKPGTQTISGTIELPTNVVTTTGANTEPVEATVVVRPKPSGGGNNNSFKPSVNSVDTTTNKPYFVDLEGYQYAQEAILSLAQQGIIIGKDDLNFEPGKNITRAEFTTLIVKLFGFQTNFNNLKSFEDVTQENWHYAFVQTASSLGIVMGVEGGGFAPDSYITREQAATMLKRACDVKVIALPTSYNRITYTDGINQYATEAIASLQMAGVIFGVNETNFAPTNELIRADAACLIYRLKLIAKL